MKDFIIHSFIFRIYQFVSHNWLTDYLFIVLFVCLIGIGGGELMGPLLLQLKVLPQVSSATTSMMSLFNSSSTIIHYGFNGSIPYEWAAIVVGIGLFGGLTGRLSALYITYHFNRPSITVFMLILILLISIILLIYHIFSDKTDFIFHTFC